MAKAAEVQLRGDDAFAAAGRAAVSVRGAEVFAHAAGVLDTTDIERVHAMRVATRRLRAVLEVFAAAFDKREHRPVLRDVKALADALGARRDPDVQIDAFERMRGELPESAGPGIDRMIATLRAEQADGNAILAGALKEAERSDLAGRLRALAEEDDPA